MNSGSIRSRNWTLFRRSGLMSRRSTSSASSCVADRVPLVAVRGVDRHRAQAEPFGGRDLVAHEREQRADQDRRPGAARRSSAVARKYTALLPHPVRWTQSTRLRPTTRSATASS